MKPKFSIGKAFVLLITFCIIAPILFSSIYTNNQEVTEPKGILEIDSGDYNKIPSVSDDAQTKANTPPSLIYPTAGAYVTTKNPTFDWSDVSGSDKYNIVVARDIGFTNIVIDINVDDSFYDSPTLAEGAHYWKVRTRQLLIFWGSFSSSRLFIIDTIPPSGVPSPIYPISGTLSTVNNLELHWSSVSDPSVYRYHLEVDDSTSFTSLYRSVEISSTYYTTTYPQGSSYWRVRVRDIAGNYGSWSSVWTFKVDSIPPGVPTLLAPEDGYLTRDRTPTFNWGDVSTATGYQIEISYNSAFTSIHTSETPSDSTYTPISDIGDGTYYWRVRARDAAGNWGPWTTGWQITIDRTPPGAPSLIDPADGTVTHSSTLGFTWSSVSTAVIYQFQSDQTDTFSSPIDDITTADLSFYCLRYDDGVYYWRVRCRDEAWNWGPWSTIWSLETDIVPPTGIPTLLSPSSGSIISNATPSYDWTDIPDADYYQIQIDDDSGFGSYVQYHVYGLSHITPIFPLSDDVYYWRVRALDIAGNYGSWSAANSFTIDTENPIISDVIHIPDAADDTDIVSVYCNVSDTNGLSQVQLHYRINSGGWTAVSMFNTFGNHYEVSIGSFGYNTHIEYYVTADDNAATANTATDNNGGLYYSLTILPSDITGPSITDTDYLPVSPTDTDSIAIGCYTADINGIHDVIVSYRINGGTWINTSMILDTGSHYLLDIGSFAYGTNIEFYITAIDDYVLHNEAIDDNTGSYYSFTIGASDVTGPTISDIGHYPIDPTELDSILINCSVSDASGVQSVVLSYQVSDSGWVLIPMFYVSGTTYEATIGPFAYADFIEYYITATDNYATHNSATDDNGGSFYSFTISHSDVTDPVITDIQHSPIVPTDAETITITCSATDANGVLFVTLFYRVNGGSWNYVNMTLTTGSTYSLTIGAFDYDDEIEYYFFATDNSPNLNSVTNDNGGSYYDFTIVSSDVTGPVIDDVEHTEDINEATLVNITCTVTDANGIQSVTLHYRLNNGTWQTMSMTLITGSSYGATLGPFEAGDFVDYYITAIDNSPNHNSETNDNSGLNYHFSVVATTPSVPIYFIIPMIATLGLIIVLRKRK